MKRKKREKDIDIEERWGNSKKKRKRKKKRRKNIMIWSRASIRMETRCPRFLLIMEERVTL